MLKKLTKVLSLLLILCLMVSMFPAVALADEGTEAPVVTETPEETTPVVTPVPEESSAPVESPVPSETPAVEASPAPSDTPVDNTSAAGDEPAADDEPASDEPGDFAFSNKTDAEDGIDPLASSNTISYPEKTRSVSLTGDFRKIVMVDAGRKYFTADWIIALINEMAADGYTTLCLAVGNDGLRFLLNDMSVTVGDTTYSSADVTAAIKAGNKTYHDFGTNELTQSEMDKIFVAAGHADIEIIPLINTPGHMDAILSAATRLTGTTCSYNGSRTTIDVTNATAVNFTYALLEKYVAYFAAKGCKAFNIGCDEYANDVYTTGGMGFGNLQSTGKYASFVKYVNGAAALVQNHGLAPICFNDGIYYNNVKTTAIDSALTICYWSSGWSDYTVRSAANLSADGFKLINTHGDFYYVLGKPDQFDSGYSYASNWSNTTFYGSSDVTNETGSMFCIWCDFPSAESETKIAQKVRLPLRAMAAEMDNKDATAIDTETVVSGGFNADGSINASTETTTIQKDGKNVSTFSVKMDGTATLSLSDSEATATWSSSDETVATVTAVTAARSIEVEANSVTVTPVGEGTATITAKLADDTELTTQVTVTAAGTSDEQEYDKEIAIEVGEVLTVTDDSGNYESSYTGEGLDTSTATVTVSGTNTTTDGSYSKAISITSGKQYLITIDGNHVVTNTSSTNGRSDYGYWSGASGLYIESVSGFAYGNNLEQYLWTITDTGSGYSVQNANGKYLTIGSGNNNVTLSDTAQVLTITDNGNTFDFSNGIYYLNNFGGSDYDLFASSWQNGKSGWTLYEYTPGTTAGTTIAFNGVYPGTTYVTVGKTTYKIVVSRMTKDITVILDEGSVTDTQTRTITEEATIEDNSIVSVEISGATVTFTGLKIGTTTVTVGDTIYNVKVSEVDLSTVEDLTIEYWITNGRPLDDDGNNSYSVSAETAYSEDGVDITTFLPENTEKESRTLEYWCGRLLDKTKSNSSTSGTEAQTETNGDDETLSGSVFTKVRYWNGKWQVFTGEWVEVTSGYQLVAYYMEVVDIKNADGESELHVNAADWGTKGDGTGNWGYTPEASRCSVSVQVVYEDGTTNPSDTTAKNLKSKTFVYGYWKDGRGLGTMIFNGQQNYQIYKVTAETGDMTSTTSGNYVTVTAFTWDENEETVWEGDATQSVSIGNPARNPSYEKPLDNLTWNTASYNKNNAILIRVYVRTVATESALTVHYIDQTANAEFYNYNIAVKDGTTFDAGFALGSEKNSLVHNTVENYNGVVQTVTADLSKMSEIGAQYRYSDYTCVKVERSEDGKEVYLYYTFNNAHSFVIDFGLPLKITTSDLGISGDWTSASVSGAQYGTATATVGDGVTYTPSQTLKGVETLQLTLTGSTGSVTHQIYIYPATTVYYEEGFASGSWTGGSTGSGTQYTEVPGAKQYNYGYDAKYANETTGPSNNTQAVSSDIGEDAVFTFTGTGVDIYANCTEETGAVSILIKNSSSNAIVKLLQVNTATGAAGSATTGQNVDSYSLPIASVTDLSHGTYTVTIRHSKTNADDANSKVYLDGFRVYGTLADQSNSIYTADLEDNPTYIELRDRVLKALSVTTANSQYASDIAEYTLAQVYATGQTTEGAVVISSNPSYTSDDVQDLLDNGPKNEIFLRQNESLVFTVTTDREVQIGLKAVDSAVTCTVNNVAKTITSSTDMFYTVYAKGAINGTETITITNNSGGILSITKLKICDDPGATLGELTEEDLIPALVGMGYEPEPEEPVVEYADATLTVEVNGQTATLTKNGVVGESATFTAEEIEAAAQGLVPEGYELKDQAEDVTVVYGESDTVTFSAEEIPTEPEKPEQPTEPEEPEQPSKPANIISAVIRLFDKIFGSLKGLFR